MKNWITWFRICSLVILPFLVLGCVPTKAGLVRGWKQEPEWKIPVPLSGPDLGVQSPTFKRIVKVYALSDKDVESYVRVLGPSDPNASIPDGLEQLLHGECRTWKGSLVVFRDRKPLPPKIDAKIVKIEGDIMTIDRGELDAVRKGMRLSIHDVETFLGTLEIQRTRLSRSEGKLVEELSPEDRRKPRVGDLATTGF